MNLFFRPAIATTMGFLFAVQQVIWFPVFAPHKKLQIECIAEEEKIMLELSFQLMNWILFAVTLRPNRQTHYQGGDWLNSLGTYLMIISYDALCVWNQKWALGKCLFFRPNISTIQLYLNTKLFAHINCMHKNSIHLHLRVNIAAEYLSAGL